jgi:FtsP/CotA-like multicopper oxidase with cupredoxin domain
VCWSRPYPAPPRGIAVAARFDSYPNPDVPYLFHCHVLDHEVLGTMGQFQVVAD